MEGSDGCVPTPPVAFVGGCACAGAEDSRVLTAPSLCIIGIDAVHIPASEERQARVLLEPTDPAYMAAQRVQRAMAAHLGHREHRRARVLFLCTHNSACSIMAQAIVAPCSPP
jgi:hypothetical protein